jgi:hypothetical protein
VLNNFVGNWEQAPVEKEYMYAGNFEDYEWGTNGTDVVSWDSGTEGNYWSDYTGSDANGDGIGDVCDPCPFDRYNDADHDGVCGYTLAQWPPRPNVGVKIGY